MVTVSFATVLVYNAGVKERSLGCARAACQAPRLAL